MRMPSSGIVDLPGTLFSGTQVSYVAFILNTYYRTICIGSNVSVLFNVLV